MDLEKGLNERQREAVETTEGPLLILAGAGSGKTRTIITRIAYLLSKGYAWPSQILAITFTNKAAREMTERLERMEGIDADGIWMSTFHVACSKILRMNAKRLGYSSNFKIVDADDQRTLVKRILREMKLSGDKDYKPAKIVSLISKYKNDRKTPEDVDGFGIDPFFENLAEVYRRYEEQIRRADSMDFDDLILNATELLKKNPDILDYFQHKFKYILVDEFQDSATRSRLKAGHSSK